MKVIERALQRLDEADKNGQEHDMIYWAAYLDGARAKWDEDAPAIAELGDKVIELTRQTTVLLKPNEKRPLHECAVCGWYFSDGDVKDYSYCPNCGRRIHGQRQS